MESPRGREHGYATVRGGEDGSHRGRSTRNARHAVSARRRPRGFAPLAWTTSPSVRRPSGTTQISLQLSEQTCPAPDDEQREEIGRGQRKRRHHWTFGAPWQVVWARPQPENEDTDEQDVGDRQADDGS